MQISRVNILLASKTFWRHLQRNNYNHSPVICFSCFLEVRLSCSISSKLQEKVLPKKTFLIRTDTVSRKECGISKQGLYLKAVCLRNCRVNKCLTILPRFVMTPDGIYDTYVHFNDDLGLDIDTYNLLIWKVNC